MYLISSCLIGVNCRYDGSSNLDKKLFNIFKNSKLYPICPEVLGGLGIPRNPCEIRSEKNEYKVCDVNGNDFTNEFKLGAEKTLKIAKILNVTGAILMDRSPSCGVHKIYDGYFNNNLIKGQGITTKLLLSNDFKVFSINDVIITNRGEIIEK